MQSEGPALGQQRAAEGRCRVADCCASDLRGSGLPAEDRLDRWLPGRRVARARFASWLADPGPAELHSVTP
eukprot:552945-Lingulodinium_polyedra.AAC.1